METYDKINHWYGWNGGECPVRLDTEVEVVYRGRSPETGPAGLEDWTHDDHSGDIIAFRIIKLHVEPPEPREWWVTDSSDGVLRIHTTPLHARMANGEAILVREVLPEDASQ